MEIISSAVKTKFHSQGVGKKMIASCVYHINDLGFENIFTLTFQEDFFEKLGFERMPKERLSSKIFYDCLGCGKNKSKIPGLVECDEVAMKLTEKQTLYKSIQKQS